MVLTFQTDQSSFEGHFSIDNTPATNGGNQWQSLRASVGLYQWLRPIDSALQWNEGACVGYQESMLAVLEDPTFDAARSFAVIAVLMGIIVSLWSMLSSCIAWNWIQLQILRVLLFLGTITAGLSFLFVRASICNDAFDPSASCELEEGGFVLIAAMIMWLAAFLISIVFAHSFSPTDMEEMHGSYHGKPGGRRGGRGGDDDDLEQARRAGAKAASREHAAAAHRARERRRRELQLHKMAQSSAVTSPTGTAKTAPRTPDTGGDDPTSSRPKRQHRPQRSLDSIDSYQHRQQAVRYLQREQAGRASSSSTRGARSPPPSGTGGGAHSNNNNNNNNGGRPTHGRSHSAATLTIDDVSTRNELEVYINEKMAKIKHLMDLDDTKSEI